MFDFVKITTVVYHRQHKDNLTLERGELNCFEFISKKFFFFFFFFHFKKPPKVKLTFLIKK